MQVGPWGEAEALVINGACFASISLSSTFHRWYVMKLKHISRHNPQISFLFFSLSLSFFQIKIMLKCVAAIPLNKQLYSFSYVCFTAGAAAIVFSGLYILVINICIYYRCSWYSWVISRIFNFCCSRIVHAQIDVWGYRKPFLFLEWIGMNAMLVFVMGAQGILAAFINGWYFKNQDNNLVSKMKEKLCKFLFISYAQGKISLTLFFRWTGFFIMYSLMYGNLRGLGHSCMSYLQRSPSGLWFLAYYTNLGYTGNCKKRNL